MYENGMNGFKFFLIHFTVSSMKNILNEIDNKKLLRLDWWRKIPFNIAPIYTLRSLLLIEIKDFISLADGDPQHGNQILGAIQYYDKNAIRENCGWYITSQGWKQYFPFESCVQGKTALNMYHTLKILIQHWIYTWIKPGYFKNKDKYNIYKQLLSLFLQSKQVLKICGNQPTIVATIKDVVSKYIFIYSSLIGFP